MIKKIMFIIVIVFCFSIIYAEDVEKEKTYESPMSLYNQNYIIAGNSQDQVKIQFSAKYSLLYPGNTGLYLGYTQLSNWFVYKSRDTFITMYAPEAIFRFDSGDNQFDNYKIPYVDYIQISPICHNSTGVEGDIHRSINVYYAQAQVSVGEVINIGANGKYFRYYDVNYRNPDINDYKKNYSAGIFLKIKSKTVNYLDKEELHFKFGGNPRGKGFYCIEAQFRILTSRIQPKFFCSYYNGYDEFMMYYNKHTKSFRAGLTF